MHSQPAGGTRTVSLQEGHAQSASRGACTVSLQEGGPGIEPMSGAAGRKGSVTLSPKQPSPARPRPRALREGRLRHGRIGRPGSAEGRELGVRPHPHLSGSALPIAQAHRGLAPRPRHWPAVLSPGSPCSGLPVAVATLQMSKPRARRGRARRLGTRRPEQNRVSAWAEPQEHLLSVSCFPARRHADAWALGLVPRGRQAFRETEPWASAGRDAAPGGQRGCRHGRRRRRGRWGQGRYGVPSSTLAAPACRCGPPRPDSGWTNVRDLPTARPWDESLTDPTTAGPTAGEATVLPPPPRPPASTRVPPRPAPPPV